MRITLIMLAAAVFGAALDVGGHRPLSSEPPPAARPGESLQARALEVPATEVRLGDVAPEFSYQGGDARWRRLRDLVKDSPVLLVFGADEPALRGLDRERDALTSLGVVPVAVVGSRLGATRAIIRRNGLRIHVLADPQGAIAAQYNTSDPATGRHRPAWFVLDARRRVRALGRHGLPPDGYAALAAEALGRPSRAASVPPGR